MKQNPNDLKAFLEALKPAPESDVQIPFAPVMPDELAQAAQLEAIQQAPAPVQNIEKPIVRAPAAQEPLKQATAPTAPEAPEAVETDGSRLERLMKDLNEQRNKEREDAASRQMKANIFKAIGESIGGMVSGAQAMNTKASVKAGPAPTINVGDLVADVDKRFSDDRKSLLDEYKALKSSQKSQGLTPYQEAMISLAMGNQGLKKDMFDQSHELRQENKARLEDENKEKQIQKVSDKLGNGQDLLNALDSFEGSVGEKLDNLNVKGNKIITEKGKTIDLPGVNVPGLGRISAYSEDARDLNAKMAKIFNVELKDRSGSAVTSPELERLKIEFGAGKFNTESDMIKAVKEYKDLVAKEIKNREAAFKPEILKEYRERGGATSERFAPAKTANSNVVERKTKDGRTALFDSATKEFKGYKD